MVILGIMDSHLSSAAVVRDGAVVAAVREESLSRVKGFARFPRRAVEAALELAGVRGADVDRVAFGIQSDLFDTPAFQAAERGLKRNAVAALSLGMPRRLLRSEALNRTWTGAVGAARRRRLEAEQGAFMASLGLKLGGAAFPPHHLCHAATALFLQGRAAEAPTLVVVCDGYGDGQAGGAWLSDGRGLRPIARLSFADSLGSVYSRVTRVLGLKPWEHEHKVMGLAPYGAGEAGEALFQRLWESYRLEGGRPHNATPYTGILLERHLERLLRGARFDHAAYAVQRLCEAVLAGWVEALMAETGVRRVALAGGCFLNVKANQAIAALPGLEALFITPPAGDDSASVGAALVAWAEGVGWEAAHREAPGLQHLFLGPDVSADLDAALAEARRAGLAVERPLDLEARVAALLAEGHLVARAEGRAEFGPRALGNRSILCPAHDLALARALNTRIKRRDFWMPFAASILDSRAEDLLVNPRALDASFMILTLPTTPQGAEELAAALHPADGTTRPQVVSAAGSPRFHRILKEYEARTGRGALLNTSFNLHGEPMVCSAADALRTFRASGLSYLALGGWLIQQPARRPAQGPGQG